MARRRSTQPRTHQRFERRRLRRFDGPGVRPLVAHGRGQPRGLVLRAGLPRLGHRLALLGPERSLLAGCVDGHQPQRALESAGLLPGWLPGPELRRLHLPRPVGFSTACLREGTTDQAAILGLHSGLTLEFHLPALPSFFSFFSFFSFLRNCSTLSAARVFSGTPILPVVAGFANCAAAACSRTRVIRLLGEKRPPCAQARR